MKEKLIPCVVCPECKGSGLIEVFTNLKRTEGYYDECERCNGRETS